MLTLSCCLSKERVRRDLRSDWQRIEVCAVVLVVNWTVMEQICKHQQRKKTGRSVFGEPPASKKQMSGTGVHGGQAACGTVWLVTAAGGV